MLIMLLMVMMMAEWTHFIFIYSLCLMYTYFLAYMQLLLFVFVFVGVYLVETFHLFGIYLCSVLNNKLTHIYHVLYLLLSSAFFFLISILIEFNCKMASNICPFKRDWISTVKSGEVVELKRMTQIFPTFEVLGKKKAKTRIVGSCSRVELRSWVELCCFDCLIKLRHASKRCSR